MWKIDFSNSARKKAEKLPNKIKELLKTFLKEMVEEGPVRSNWPNYAPLSKSKKDIPQNAYHCHLKNGKPTYVICWRLEDKKIKIIEVFYVGTHENAPY